VGTRGSRLALWQADHVRSLIAGPSEVVVIRTSGDRLKDAPLQGQSTTGFFTREIEKALLGRRVDLAVHSLKDLPVEQPEGLVLGAILERHDPGDVLLVGPDAHDPSLALPVRRGARVGAGSLRRRSALLAYRPDLEPVLVRGNVETRVRKAVQGLVDAIVLARAGLVRLGLDPSPLVAYDLSPEGWIPSPGQACVAVEVRQEDVRTRDLARRIDHAGSRACVELERRLLAMAGGGCHAPFAAWARAAHVTGGFDVSVGAPASDGSWRGLHLCGTAAEVEAEARKWFGSGCEPSLNWNEEGLCRAARPWF
jgi:hydroxymethylbilane synthase